LFSLHFDPLLLLLLYLITGYFSGILRVFYAFSVDPTYDLDISSANSIAPNVEYSWHYEHPDVNTNLPPHWVIIGIKYSDPITKSDYSEIFYCQWEGIKNDILYSDISSVTIPEKEMLKEKYKNYLSQYLQ